MTLSKQQIDRITNLEWANYAASLVTAQVTPGLDVVLRDDVIITSSDIFPSPDANHACLLRATPKTIDGLIAEVIDHFKPKGLPTTVFISPACTPADLPDRLLKQGFVKQKDKEAWVVLDNLLDLEIPPPFSNAAVTSITKDQVLTFAEIFLTAFGIPLDFAPYMAQLLEPSLEQPSIHHYLALVDEQPAGIMSLLRHKSFGVFGSGGVLPAYRKSGAATNLAIRAATDAKKYGVDTLMGQTKAGTSLERLLRISGFNRVFTRTCYTLS
ncbi:MAG: GNAT family N-acetyltransferase [Chloroflexi bacterium]|nr:GNAT family N-acetyltransferase [Chloroflexota bacterium]